MQKAAATRSLPDAGDEAGRRDFSGLKVVRVAPTLRQQVVDVLRGAIVDGKFLPGERLVERELCERTGMSRTTVREALRHLESEGFIENVPNRGPVVATVSIDQAREVYEARVALEGAAGRLFIERASPAQVARLRAAVDRFEAAVNSGSMSRMIAAKTAFYDIFFEGINNEIIAGTVRSLNLRMKFLRAQSMSQPGRAPQSVIEIRKILAAIEARDAAAAQQACADHVLQAASVGLKVLANLNAARQEGAYAAVPPDSSRTPQVPDTSDV